MSGDRDPVPLRSLRVVQPPDCNSVSNCAHFTDFTPLNHLEHAVPPESDTAREFNEIAKADRFRKSKSSRVAAGSTMAVAVADNDAKLQPLLHARI